MARGGLPDPAQHRDQDARPPEKHARMRSGRATGDHINSGDVIGRDQLRRRDRPGPTPATRSAGTNSGDVIGRDGETHQEARAHLLAVLDGGVAPFDPACPTGPLPRL